MSLPAPEGGKRNLRGFAGAVLRRALAISPGPIEVGDAICQAFIRTDGKKTTYTLVNFPSLLSPSDVRDCRYELNLYDQNGLHVGSQRVNIPARGTAEVQLETLFKEPLPEMGLLTVQICAGSWLSYSGRHLGPIRAHFYAMYHDAEMRSMAVVHPQSSISTVKAAPIPWRSSMVICPANLEAIELFQINPTSLTSNAEISIRTLDGLQIKSSSATMPPMGIRRVFWKANEFAAHVHMIVASEALTAPNAKPLLFQHFKTGFSASHS